MAKRLLLRRDVASNWTTVDPILADGEVGYESDTGKMKVGDGATIWSLLPYRLSSGEINTASNAGTLGIGVFDGKVLEDLEFRNLVAGSSKVTITLDGANKEIDINVVDGQIDHDGLLNTHNLTTDIVHQNITGAGTNDHTAIDSHIAATNNPHSVTKTQVGLSDVQNILSNFAGTVAPAVTDDSGAGYSVGSKWVDTVADEAYQCVDSTIGAAVWKNASLDQTEIDHTNLQNIGTNTHAQIDTHIADTTVHFTEGSIDHTAIQNIGTKTHATLDTEVNSLLTDQHTHVNKALLDTYSQTEVNLADAVSKKHTQNSDTSLDFGNANQVTAAEARTHLDDATIHFTEASIDHTAIQNIGTNTHAQLDTGLTNSTNHIANTSNPHSVTKTQVGLPNVQDTLNNFVATVAPIATDDSASGYSVGSVWIDVTADKSYTLVDSTALAAVWLDTSVVNTDTTDHTLLTNIGVKTHATLDTEVDSLLTDQHTHANKALLDTYSQTEVDLADAVSKKHAHANQVALDAVSGTNTGDQDLTAINAHVADVTTNPHNVTAAQVGSPALATSIDNRVIRANGTAGEQQTSLVEINDTGDIIPAGNQTQDLGSVTNKFLEVHATLGDFVRVNGGGTVNLPPASQNDGGIVAGTLTGSGSKTITLNGGPFPAIAAIGNVAASSATGTAVLESSKGGAVCFGSAYAYGSGTALVSARGFSSFTAGYAYGSGTSTLEATASGSLAFGYANGKNGGSTSVIQSTNSGAFAAGFATTNSNTATSRIRSSGRGSFAVGMVSGGSSFESKIEATQNGAFAQGYSKVSNLGTPSATRISATGRGAFAQGYVQHGIIEATATNSVQFGVGTNSTANSFKMAEGIHIQGDGVVHWLTEIATPPVHTAGSHALYFDISGDDKLRIQDDTGAVETVISIGTLQTYTESGIVTDRTYDATATTLTEVANVLGTLIADLRAAKIIA